MIVWRGGLWWIMYAIPGTLGKERLAIDEWVAKV
jgi:hypothetical protein